METALLLDECLPSSYSLHSKVYSSEHCDVYSGTLSGKPIVLKILKPQYNALLDAFIRECSINSLFSKHPNIITVVSHFQCFQTHCLVMEDFGGKDLYTYTQNSTNIRNLLSIDTVLHIGISMCSALTAIHLKGYIHKDISLRNILFNPQTQHTALIDFGISDSVEKRMRSSREGTPLYCSPEQTGNIDIPVDSRSDLYSLGVCLYFLICGEFPFEASIEEEALLAAHVSSLPPSLKERDSSTPNDLNNIVMILLKKDPEKRYQSAFGLAYDLEMLSKGHTGLSYRQRDFYPKINTSRCFYGRVRESAEINTLIDQTATSDHALLGVVWGPAGIGKTHLIHHVFTTHPAKMIFATGKNEQFRSLPFQSLRQVIHVIFDKFLGLPLPKVQEIQSNIITELGHLAGLLYEAVPYVLLFMKSAQDFRFEKTAYASVRSSQRAQLLARAITLLFHVITTYIEPVAMFLDDVQWADELTFLVLNSLLNCSDSQRLCIVLGVRTHGSNNALVTPLIKNQNDRQRHVTALRLTSFTLSDVDSLLTSLFHRESETASSEEITELAEVVVQKTAGSPFSVMRFISALEEKNLLFVDKRNGRFVWNWDIEQVKRVECDENAISIISKRIAGLTPTELRLLQIMGCFGAEFDVDRFISLRCFSGNIVFEVIDKFVEMNLIDSVHENVYRFVHDKIPQAVLQGLENDEEWKIRWELVELMRVDETEWLSAADQISRCSLEFLLEMPFLGILSTLEILTSAAERAKQECCFELGLVFTRHAVQLAGFHSERLWEENKSLLFRLYVCASALEFQDLKFESACKYLVLMLEKTEPSDVLRLAELHRELCSCKYVMALNKEALEHGILAFELLCGSRLSRCNFSEFEQNCTAIGAFLEKRNLAIEDILHLPEMTNPRVLAIVKTVSDMVSQCYSQEPLLLRVIISRTSLYILEHGVSPATSVVLVFLALYMSNVLKDREKGRRYGAVGLQLCDRFQDKSQACKVHHCYVVLLLPWIMPLMKFWPITEKGIVFGNQWGDSLFASVSYVNRIAFPFYQGHYLPRLYTYVQESLEYSRRNRSFIGEYFTIAVDMALQNVRGYTSSSTDFSTKEVSERDFMAMLNLPADDHILCYFYAVKAFALLLNMEYEACYETSKLGFDLLAISLGQFNEAILHFTYCVSISARRDGVSDVTDDELMVMEKAADALGSWSEQIPDNFSFMHCIAQAELMRQKRKNSQFDVMKMYQSAVAYAAEFQFPYFDAIANQRCAMFLLTSLERLESYALEHFVKAAHSFQKTGADRCIASTELKIKPLRRETSKAPHSMTVNETTSDVTTTPDVLRRSVLSITHGFTAYDVDTFIGAALVISREIVLDSLLRKLISVLLLNCGAQRVYLLCADKNTDQYTVMGSGSVQCESKVAGETALSISIPEISQMLTAEENIPLSVVRHVMQTNRYVLLDDLSEDARFCDYHSSTQNTPRSVICLYLCRRDYRSDRGENSEFLLYLDNARLRGAFNESRFQFLRLMAQQTSVALQNAYLYRDLQESMRNIDAQNAMLKQLTKEAQKANNAKSDFLANMTHELRTPLNAILGLSSLLLENHLDKKSLSMIQTICNSGKLLLELINSLLDLSKLEAKKLVMGRIDIDIREIVMNCLEIVRLGKCTAKTYLVCNLALDAPSRVVGDSLRLTQVFLNLIGNSAKFTESGEVEVTSRVLTEKSSQSHVMVEFCVRDTGIGISQDGMGLLFNRFEQIDSSISRKFGGTGLGLFLSKKLVELMGGEISVYSNGEGKGATFTFSVLFERSSCPEISLCGAFSAYNNLRCVIDIPNACLVSRLARVFTYWGLQVTEVNEFSQGLDTTDFRYIIVAEKVSGPLLTHLVQSRDKVLLFIRCASLDRPGDSLGIPEDDLASFDHFHTIHYPLDEKKIYEIVETTIVVPHVRDIFTPTEKKGDHSMSPLRFLVVDDNRINRQLLATMLKRLGHVTSMAVNGKEAVALVELCEFDAVLMDIQMPVMDGIAATRRIRKSGNSQLPIIAVSANYTLAQTSEENIFTAVLPKVLTNPFSH